MKISELISGVKQTYCATLCQCVIIKHAVSPELDLNQGKAQYIIMCFVYFFSSLSAMLWNITSIFSFSACALATTNYGNVHAFVKVMNAMDCGYHSQTQCMNRFWKCDKWSCGFIHPNLYTELNGNLMVISKLTDFKSNILTSLNSFIQENYIVWFKSG